MSGGAGEVLAYAPVEGVRKRGWVGWVFVGFGVLAAVTPWVPFAHRISPWDVVWAFVTGAAGASGDAVPFLLIASPFFVGVVMGAWKVRLAIWRRCGGWERAGAWLTGMASMGATGFLLFFLLVPEVVRGGRWNDSEGYCSMVGLGLIFGGAVAAWWLWWKGRRREVVALVPMYTAYLANGAVCMGAFWGAGELGWWLTGLVCGGLLAELAMYVAGVGAAREG
ncbi:MAG: hypothetical protein ACTHN5_21420 [Phycisphaerae bacterium]